MRSLASRANAGRIRRPKAIGGNVNLKGRRNTIKYVDAPVAKNQWHSLRVGFAVKLIRVSLDGKLYIDVEDEPIGGPGAVGVWTKA